ncbi:MAG: Rrf2 family transcriptional regulator [Oscillospiraceae bacterium]|nr:Rrf2 family transcriptional regulator [Oscillospiraceae bacterium]
MKIPTKSRYGLQFMLMLAAHYRKGIIPLREIAEQENLSEKYLEQIVVLFTKAGLVKSVRGARGGYRLAQPPETIRASDVLRLSGDPMLPQNELLGVTPAMEEESPAIVSLWTDIQAAVSSVVDSVSLADLAQKQQESHMIQGA